LKFAAIDIGSNAVRLLFMNVYLVDGTPVYKKDFLIRVPLRLGEDSFMDGVVSKKKVDKLVKTMDAFRNLIEVNDALDYRVCATAALREARNGPDIVKEVEKKTGVKIEIIDGDLEASVINSNDVVKSMEEPEKNYLYIDVGGGSTEISLFVKRKLIKSVSYPIGTLKILNDQVAEKDWIDLRETLKDFKDKYGQIYGIGSGGNINKIQKLYGNTKGGFITSEMIKHAHETLSNMTISDRIKELGLRPDRADVIVPATEIHMLIMKWAGIRKIFVPKIGLSDGIVKNLYHSYVKGKLKIAV
jgi:exopolyphosphatase / guanosine-5'-triphosphate,3'-diphosphate pyrophosphatase